MALIPSSFPSSSSWFSYSWTYDVFISFRGSDTRYEFTGNLYNALCDKGIRTFMDDRELERGDEIRPSLEKAIKESRIAVVVFSENYASSSFCLHELATIMESAKGNGRLVLPIFYKVDPSAVRHQSRAYEKAMAKHEERFKDDMDKVHKWRKALRQAADKSGDHFKFQNDKYEYKSIKEIVKVIFNKVNRKPLYTADYPVGLESSMRKVEQLLNGGFDGGALMVGIHGMGGIGKSTLARAIFNSIANQFDDFCFLENVKEYSSKHGLGGLQGKLLSKILGDENIKIESFHEGIPIIKDRFSRKKILLVVDDVDEIEQLRAIVGDPCWFGPGSRVIITTRDKHLLESHGIKKMYEIDGLSEEDARVLLCWNAFRSEKYDQRYEEVVKRAITYACGLPLALEVIGSHLFGKDIHVWRSALDEYEKFPNQRVQKILEISYAGLGEIQKKIFLDIACCFNGYELSKVNNILHASYEFSPENSIDELKKKSLLKVDFGFRVTLHDLIRDMGTEIVHRKSPENPGKRSRLWFHKDIIQVLEENSGTSAIEIITLDAPKNKKVVVEWDGYAFKNMNNLKILIIRNAYFLQGVKHLPNSLRVLEWDNEHPSMSIELIEKPKLMYLKILSICGTNIEKIPDISGAPNLEELSLDRCENLIEVHKSVGLLDKLRHLKVSRCSKLRDFPALKLPSLQQLDFIVCSSLENFPELSEETENVTDLIIWDTPVKELPSYLTKFNFRNLTSLQIYQVDGILRLPSSIATVQSVYFQNVKGLQFLKDVEEQQQLYPYQPNTVSFSRCKILDENVETILASCRNADYFDLSQNNFTILPESITELCSLRNLDLSDCKNLKEIRGIPPNIEYLDATGCTSLSPSSRSMLLNEEYLHSGGYKCFCLPGDSIPKWFEHKSKSKSKSISLWFRNKLPPFSLCVVSADRWADLYLTINGKPFVDMRLNSLSTLYHVDERLLLRHKDGLLSKYEWNHLVFALKSYKKEECILGEIGIHFDRDSSNMEDIRFTDPLMQTSSSTTFQGDAEEEFESEALDLFNKAFPSTVLTPSNNHVVSRRLVNASLVVRNTLLDTTTQTLNESSSLKAKFDDKIIKEEDRIVEIDEGEQLALGRS